jgi:hypothetical protein
VTQICVTADPACGADPRKLAFWCAAIDAQAAEFATSWGVEYTPVVFYSTDVLSKLADAALSAFTADSRLLTIQPTLDVNGALGYHDDIGGVIFARVMWQGDATSVTISHEVLEEMGDPTCDQYRPMGNGKSTALEACDAVEGDEYTVAGVIGSDSIPVQVSNYLQPTWFGIQQDGNQEFDRMGKLSEPFTMTSGGYMVVMDASGSESQVFARVQTAGPAAHANLAAKLAGDQKGRLLRRLRGRWAS